jgi:hypothetical protein
MNSSRRQVSIALLAALAGLGLSSHSYAGDVQVPFVLQASLMAKVAGFDRNFSARAGSKAVVLLVTAPGDTDSARAALAMKSALSELPKIGDLPHEEEIVSFTNANALADLVRSKRAAIVYFGPGFGKHVPAIRDAFSTVSVLTVGAVAEYVPDGIVLGFDLVSGHPKLLVKLEQARKQQISFPASVLSLMKVYR